MLPGFFAIVRSEGTEQLRFVNEVKWDHPILTGMSRRPAHLSHTPDPTFHLVSPHRFLINNKWDELMAKLEKIFNREEPAEVIRQRDCRLDISTLVAK